VFVAPPGAQRLPTLIHLHGSEGGSINKARHDAMTYAGRGFATLAIAYFAWDYEAEGLDIPRSHINIPVETLDRARAWLASRPESDAARIGLIGNSKGGEFAVLGAATYPWVRATVGCVPSDVVWEGYGRTARPGEAISSWSLGGAPLPYIPTYNDRAYGSPEDVWPNNGARYTQARAEFAAATTAARIPVERITRPVLLIGGDRDETWASGAMSRSIVAQMRRAGHGRLVTARVAPTAGHSLCGDGMFPSRAYQTQSSAPGAPDIDDEGAAAVAAFGAKIAFMRRWL
jgi:dipeptidyl aminopeptidase/acylaminoacyl peptidase